MTDKMANNESKKSRKGSIVERVAMRVSSDLSQELARRPEVPVSEEMLSELPSDFGLADKSLVSAAAPEPGPEFGPRRESREGGRPDAGLDTMISQRAGKEPARLDLNLPRLTALGYLTPNAAGNRKTEEYRLIKRAVLNCHRNGARSRSNLILITSALPNEGKTFTAINLAFSMTAEEDISVLLIDADFNGHGAVATLGCHEKTGLIDILENPDASLADVMLKTNIPNLSVVPAGQSHKRSTELLAGARMKQLTREIANQNQNRFVLFDCPPLLATTEAAALTAHVGQVLFVVRAEATKAVAVQDALNLIDHEPEVGLILNRARPRFFNSIIGDYYTGYQAYDRPATAL
jgi:receptor protein-tyrosine kinase